MSCIAPAGEAADASPSPFGLCMGFMAAVLAAGEQGALPDSRRLYAAPARDAALAALGGVPVGGCVSGLGAGRALFLRESAAPRGLGTASLIIFHSLSGGVVGGTPRAGTPFLLLLHSIIRSLSE